MHNTFNISTFFLFLFVSIICAHPVRFYKNDQVMIVNPNKEIMSPGQMHMVKRTTGLNINTGNFEAVCPHCNGSGCSACKDGQTRNRQKNKDEESMKEHHQNSHGHSHSVQSGINKH